MDYRITFAQNREDIIIAEFLKSVKKGFYVDVGANDPDIDSVTKCFYMSGWHGINIEPSSKLHAKLAQKRRRDINLKLGVGAANSEEQFREYPQGDGLSTFSQAMKEEYNKSKYSPTVEYVDSTVPIRTLATIFKENPVPQIDFMKIDIEGYEYEAIIGNEWKKYRPKLLCIEANHIDKDWRPILAQHNYEKVFFDGLNEYYLAQEHRSLADTFSYPEAVLSTTCVKPELYKLIRSNEEEVRRLKQDLDAYYIQLMHASNHAALLEKELNSLRYEGNGFGHAKTSTPIFKVQPVLQRAKHIRYKLKSRWLVPSRLEVTSQLNLTHEVHSPQELLSAIRGYDYMSQLFNEKTNAMRSKDTKSLLLKHAKKARAHARHLAKDVLGRRKR